MDTNVLISAVGWDGNERKVIEKALNGEVTLIIGDEVLDEFHEVVQRQKFSFIDRGKLEQFILLLTHFSEIVHPKEKVCLITDDPDDNKVLESSLEGMADIILTGDKHLLKLRTFEGRPIMKPARFLKVLCE